MGDWTGTVPTFTAGEKARGSEEATVAAILAALTDDWTTWTPTLTNLTLGSGTLTAEYRRLGKTVDFFFKFIYGAGSAVGTAPQFTLPANMAAHYYAVVPGTAIGGGLLLDSGTASRPAFLIPQSATTLQFAYLNATPAFADITATVPWTWTTGDSLQAWGTYKTA